MFMGAALFKALNAMSSGCQGQVSSNPGLFNGCTSAGMGTSSLSRQRHSLSGRGAVQSVERHVQRVPGTGKLQSGVVQRMHVGGDGYFVVEPPAPFALAAQKVVDHALYNLAKCPGTSRDRVVERRLPSRPAVFASHRLGTLQQRSPGA